MTLSSIVKALGGVLYAGGRRASIPAPGHSRSDRSVSLLLRDDRVIIHCFGASDWREVRAELQARRLIGDDGRIAGVHVSGHQAPPPGSRPDRLSRVRRAEAIWDDCSVLIPASPAGRYLQRRAVSYFGEGDDALRAGRVPVRAYADAGARLPALVAAIRDGHGLLSAVEITYLDPDGRRLDRPSPSRKIIGVLPAGCAVRLQTAQSKLLVAEGVFTALSAGVRFARPAWALLSAGALSRWSPPSFVREVMIAADAGDAGERSARILAHRLRRQGLRVDLRWPPIGEGDWNDLAQKQAVLKRRGP